MPFLFVLRSRGVLPRGSVTVLVGTIAWLSVAVVDFPPTAVAGALGATLGAAMADAGLVWAGRLVDRQLFALLLAAGVAALVWSGQLGGLAVAAGLNWPVSLYSGVIVLSSLSAAALGVLADRPAPE